MAIKTRKLHKSVTFIRFPISRKELKTHKRRRVSPQTFAERNTFSSPGKHQRRGIKIPVKRQDSRRKLSWRELKGCGSLLTPLFSFLSSFLLTPPVQEQRACTILARARASSRPREGQSRASDAYNSARVPSPAVLWVHNGPLSFHCILGRDEGTRVERERER